MTITFAILAVLFLEILFRLGEMALAFTYKRDENNPYLHAFTLVSFRPGKTGKISGFTILRFSDFDGRGSAALQRMSRTIA